MRIFLYHRFIDDPRSIYQYGTSFAYLGRLNMTMRMKMLYVEMHTNVTRLPYVINNNIFGRHLLHIPMSRRDRLDMATGRLLQY